MERAGLLWTAVLGGLLVCAGAGACSDKKSAIMLAVTTDMKAPKDVNAVSVTVSTNNNVKHNVIGRVTPEGDILLPATLAIVEPEDPNASVRIRVMAFQERKARVLRDVRTSIPSGGRVALLRIPLNFVNDGSTIGEIPANVLPAPNPGTGSSSGSAGGSSGSAGTDGGLLDGGSSGTVSSSGDPSASSSSGGSGDSFDPFVFVPNCPNPEDTWIDGECKDAYIDPNTLPDFDESQVGRGDQEGVCFDVAKCFANAAPIGEGAPREGEAPAPGQPGTGGTDGKDFAPQAITLDTTSCSLQLNGEDAAKLNLAIVTPDTGECIRPGACYIPLDSGPGGWRAENGQVKLPGFVCKLITSKNLQLHHSIGCDAKKESNPICLEKAPTTSSGGAIAATLVLPEDFPTAVHYVDERRLLVAGQKRIALLDISGATASATDVVGIVAGERLPWRVDHVGTDEMPAIALTNATNQAWVLAPNDNGLPSGVGVSLPGPGMNAAGTGFGVEGFYLWGVGGPNGGYAQSPRGGGPATKTGGAFAEQVTTIAESSGTVVIGDANGGVRLCNVSDGLCKPRNQLVPGRIDVIRLSFSDGAALGGDGIYRSTVVDLETGQIAGSPIAVPARVTGPTIDGRYFRHDLFPLGDRCVVFTSEDGVEVAAGDQRRVLVPLDGGSGRHALGVHLAPKLGAGTLGGQPVPAVYFTVFAPRDQGGGVYMIDAPTECVPPPGGAPDAGDSEQCHQIGNDCTDPIVPCCEGVCVQEADRKVCRLQP